MASVNGAGVPCVPNIKSPNKLYDLCLTNLVNYLQKAKCDRYVLRTLPDNVLMDVYIKNVPHTMELARQQGQLTPPTLDDYPDGSKTMLSSLRRGEQLSPLLRCRDVLPEWLDRWRISVVNVIKTAALLIGRGRRSNMLPPLQLRDQDVAWAKMLTEKRHCLLGHELSELHIFERLLRFSGNHFDLLQCFQAVIEHGDKLPAELAAGYEARCDEGEALPDSLIHLGLRLGSFLNEAGWYADAERVLVRCRDVCLSQPLSTYYKRLTLECCHRLLNTQSAYCCFPAAAETYSLVLQLMGLSEKEARSGRVQLPPALGRAAVCSASVQTEPALHDSLYERSVIAALQLMGLRDKEGPGVRVEAPPPGWDRDAGVQTEPTRDDSLHVRREEGAAGCAVWGGEALGARLCRELSALFFVRCDYSLAHTWAGRALHLLRAHHPPALQVDVLRTAAKASVVKRRFAAAGSAARGAESVARRAFGTRHPRYAAALLDYGFYLLNIDSIVHSVAVYEEALSILRAVFGRSSLRVATAQEDLAYALYVQEYSSGRFYKARDHAERAIRIIEDLVPPDHLLLASAKRVKALILEEIALDTPAGQDPNSSQPSLLEESEALHRAALALSMMAFGEKNVQTAKHYGNLGRLYQSMQKFQDAETMHLKAIAIKEELLGAEDYEVGLSVGHLASLYNYHMNMHQQAEQLYLRSINISLKLFGERYSGLEYDYRGLVHVFTQLKKHDRAEHYTRLLHHWSELREQSKAEPQPALGAEQEQEPYFSLQEIQEKFFGND